MAVLAQQEKPEETTPEETVVSVSLQLCLGLLCCMQEEAEEVQSPRTPLPEATAAAVAGRLLLGKTVLTVGAVAEALEKETRLCTQVKAVPAL